MSKLITLLGALFCMGCAPAAQTVAPVDPSPVEAIRPTGPFPVGVAAGPVLPGGAPSRVYYPASAPGQMAGIEPFSAAHRTGLERRFGPGVADALGRAVTAGTANAPQAEGRFPLIVFQPGASMAAADYRLLIEDLASRGYVVLALNPEGSPPVSGDRYPASAREFYEAAALARAGHPSLAQADTSRLALIGHSLGGASAVMALADVPGAVAVNLDGDFSRPVRIPAASPVLYLIGQTPDEAGRSRDRRANAWGAASTGAADAVVMQIVDLKHFDFADAALLQKDVPEGRRASRFGAIGGPAGHALTVDLVAAFLDSRLKGDTTSWTAARGRHPEAAAPTSW